MPEVIINQENDRFLSEKLNILKYLSAPNFSNSWNQHIDQVYRISIENKKTLIEQGFVEFKDVALLGELCKKLSQFALFLRGIISLFSHKNLDLIKEVFDTETGKPKYFEKVTHWPIIKIDYSDQLKRNIENQVKNSISDLVVEFPLAKQTIGKVVGSLVETIGEKCIPGTYLLLDLLVAFATDKIDLKKFESENFDMKIDEIILNQSELENIKGTEIEKSEFSYTFENNYRTEKSNTTSKEFI